MFQSFISNLWAVEFEMKGYKVIEVTIKDNVVEAIVSGEKEVS